MHIFAGQRFGYNPLEGAVPGAYFDKSPTGWIDTELFYDWLANHFSCHVVIRPVVLLVDGHKSHINLEISRFCKENRIFLYCLPPHSSHITQPLDVGIFKPLKAMWRKECAKYRMANPGHFVSKKVFSSVFKEAWLHTVQPTLLINSFRGAGIYPLNFSNINEARLPPSKLFHPGDSEDQPTSESASSTLKAGSQQGNSQALIALESVLDRGTIEKYNVRYEEGYDLTNDNVYTTWKKLKDLHVADARPKTTESGNDDRLELQEMYQDNRIPPSISIDLTPGRAKITMSS